MRRIVAATAAALGLVLPHLGVAAESGGPPAAAKPKAPARVSLVRMISWAETGPQGCETDLEGTSKPASFTLRYRESGKKRIVIESSPDQLFAAGWGVITRSARGMGFEKAGSFDELDFDIVEELRCSCESKGAESVKENHLVKVKVSWKKGHAPVVTASTLKGQAWEETQPVTINGRLPSWDFRFAHTLPGGGSGECSSRFDAALALDQPLE